MVGSLEASDRGTVMLTYLRQSENGVLGNHWFQTNDRQLVSYPSQLRRRVVLSEDERVVNGIGYSQTVLFEASATRCWASGFLNEYGSW
jgi:hypothetical protein